MIPRDLALETLNRPEHSPVFPERYLDGSFRQDTGMNERDRAFTVHLVQGVFRWRLRLDWIIKQGVRFSFNKIDPPILNILRIAVYQIFFMDRVPESAAVNEAVKQAKAVGKGHIVKFVNGILRHICRHKDKLSSPNQENDPSAYLSVFYSYPQWLVNKWLKELGFNSTKALLDAENRPPHLVVRTNRLKVRRQELIKRLENEGIEGTATRYSPDGIIVEDLKGPVNRLKAFKEGLFQVQGEAAQICSHLLSPGPGDSVLDLCAGLGGKSTHLAGLMGDRGRVLALDISHGRLIKLIRSSCRLGISCIEAISTDAARHLSSVFHFSFDKILIDGPCSGLGIISRHPDIKWARDEKDIKRLSQVQKKILNQAAPLLRKGGAMLYVTCTISSEENEDVVGDFLEKHRGMALQDLREHVPEWGLELIDDQGFLKTLPHIHGIEGFFGALFIKN
ncbi:MAG: 16S rRNA (cytosine(967)-C(5))-methyltransferase RsmB [Desulfobacterales bacterium]|nr:16S rRNA (cytosine(967)-C(5))-methyltransferase RsmB [Desulfobacterales bacterium]